MIVKFVKQRCNQSRFPVSRRGLFTNIKKAGQIEKEKRKKEKENEAKRNN